MTGYSTVTKIVPEVCEAIIQRYGEEFLKFPQTQDAWLAKAQRFADRWNFPHCLGAMDGKHFRIKSPGQGSLYYSYKKYHSIILMAIVDADYRFIYVDVGAKGSAGDPGLFNSSRLGSALRHGRANLPDDESIDGETEPMPYFLLGDDAFALQTWLMKPYPFTPGVTPERKFTYRLSRARRVVECGFGILVQR